MVSGQWSVVNGQWLIVSGEWSVVSGRQFRQSVGVALGRLTQGGVEAEITECQALIE
ncbi:hypothetical protein H6G89_23885 [Oscillatoria sp. FACHB-1407]|uniref:hypothetical protein n=1 Tax=Oscillatoria sp. FACHB-1407 TaxID=2692847 RepID=UPI0016853957|nr:hypothetical protein [Oscillatoria sp. FACHB-1407]MBD2464048.1 hypothetical protein [Oscillatoria sp. FACHB-1407]